MSLFEVLNSNIVLLILGFIFTTVAGALISSRLQKATWQRQTGLDLFRKRYEEGTQFLDDLSQLIGTRYFLVLIFSVVALVITEIIARIAGMNG